MKWLVYLVFALAIGASWMVFNNKGKDLEKLEQEITVQEEAGDPESKVGEMRSEVDSIGGERTFTGILLTFLSAGFIGIFFVLQVLPTLAHRATHAIYDSAEMMEHDVMHDARSLLAQGDYHGAIAAFQQAAAADPLNRLPWVEIAKIYKDNLGDAPSAIQIIRHALESQEWEISDAAYFLFRLAELYDEIEGDRASAVAIMQQVVEQFPNTRHSANANHKLHEWSLQDEAARAAAEEQEYIERMRAAEQAEGGIEPTEATEATEATEPSAYEELPEARAEDAGGDDGGHRPA